MPEADDHDPWLDPERMREGKAAGRDPREQIQHQFEMERERLRAQVREFRRSLETRRRELDQLRGSGASDDAIAASSGNIEHLRGQLTELIRSFRQLEQRREQVLRALPVSLDAQAAIDEVERLLRDELP